MEKRKGGIYAQWYEIVAISPIGRKVNVLIYSHQANSYPKAVRYYNEHIKPKGYKGLYLVNAQPFTTPLYC